MVKYQDVEDFRKQRPEVHFIKVKNRLDRSAEIDWDKIREDFVPDYYEPVFPEPNGDESIVIFPLPIEAYPDVLEHVTATQAGIYALNMIDKQHWQETYSSVCSCLTNLEMDWR